MDPRSVFRCQSGQTMTNSGGPVADLLVVELASVLAGPSVGQFFAELGARVIKVENPRGGDVTRSWTAPGQPPGSVSAYFACCNYGKESVALDFRQPAARDLLLRLLDRADIVTMSFRRGSAERLGIGADLLRSRNPRLIVGRISGYGPEDSRPGYDAVIQAESGLMSINGDSASGPTKMPVAMTDILAAHQLKEGLLLALLRRNVSGEGSVVDVSLLDSALSSLVNQATNYFATGRVPSPTGSAHPNIVPYGSIYRTADGGAVVLAVGTDKQFGALCHAVGRSDLSDDERFAHNADRVACREILEGELTAAIRTMDRDDLLEQLARVGVPAGAVRQLNEAFADNGHVVLGRDQSSHAVPGLRQVVFTSASGSTLTRPPRLGADTSSVLADLCQATDEEIDEATRNADTLDG